MIFFPGWNQFQKTAQYLVIRYVYQYFYMDQMDQMNSVLNYYKWQEDYQPFFTILNYIAFPDDEETQHSDFQTPAPSESNNNNHPHQIFEQNTETQSTSASNLCVESEPPDDIGPVNCSPKGPNIINRGSALSISQQAVQPCPLRLAFRPLKKLAKKVLAKQGALGKKFDQIISSILTKAKTIKHLMRFFYYAQYIEKEIPGFYHSLFEEYQHLCQAEHLTKTRDGSWKGLHQSQKNKLLGQILAHLNDFLTKKSFDLVLIWELGQKKRTTVRPQFQPVKHHHERMSTRRSTQTSETESVYYQQCKKAHQYKSIVNRRQRFISLEEQLSQLEQEARIEIRKIRQEHRRSA